ncbi:MAG: EAL domain-containing protein [Gammaproteobacteria bacterium]|nr:EAL domain-containing protein [Gammaproteobacteria bacterium]
MDDDIWLRIRSAVSATTAETGVEREKLITEINALESAQGQLTTLLQTMVEGVVLQHSDGRILECNIAAEKILGLTRDQMAGKTSMDPSWRIIKEDGSAFPGEEHPSMVALRTGQVMHDIIMGVYKPDGALSWISVDSAPLIHEGDDKPYSVVTTFTDITEIRTATKELQKLALIARETSNVVVITDKARRIEWVNQAFTRITGYTADEVMGKSPGELLQGENTDLETVARIRQHLDEGKGFREDLINYSKDGTEYWVQIHVEPVFNDQGELVQFIAIETEFTERKKQEEQIRLLANVFENSGEGILITDADNTIIAVNKAFEQLSGYQQDEVLGKNPNMLSSGKTDPSVYVQMWQELQEKNYWQGEVWDRRKDGTIYPKWLHISAVRNDTNEIINFIGSFSDVTERKAAEQKFKRLAHFDPLTKLANRFSMEDQLEQLVATAGREASRFAVMFIDLDRFKIINDSFGHHVGDELLVNVAQRLRGAVRSSDTVARPAGDEFVILLRDIKKPSDAAQVAEKILHSMATPILNVPQEITSSPSIGISLFPEDGEDAPTLMKHADTAMYHAKASGRNDFRFFSKEMNEATAERFALESDLRRARMRDELEVHFQPRVELNTGRVTGAEALLRWLHPIHVQVSPAAFIPVAEDSGLIIALGEQVLKKSLQFLNEFQNKTEQQFSISINLSHRQLRDQGLVSTIAQTLEEAKATCSMLEFELPESVFTLEHEIQNKSIEVALKSLDCALILDDFGIADANLAKLASLGLRSIKISRSVIAGIPEAEQDKRTLRGIVGFARALGLRVIAMGVENERQLEFLREIGCDEAQGYLFSPALPDEEFLQWYEQHINKTAH